MPADAYLSLLAATNMKQRVRKLREYTWADRLSYAVIGHAEPARVRPGILRQGRRRARRREADRRALQGPGLRAGARARAARGDRHAAADDGDVLAAADPGGVLLRLLLRAHGRADVGARTRRRPGRPQRPGRDERRGGRRRLRARSSAVGPRRRTCTLPRCWSRRRPDVCGIAGIVRSDPSDAVDEQALLRMARAIRHRGPDGFGILLDPGAGLVSTRLSIVDLEHGWQPLLSDSDGSVLVYNGEVYNHVELREWMSSLGVPVQDQKRHRGRPRDCSSARASTASAAERPVRVRLVAAPAAPADARSRPLRRPAAAATRLRDDGSIVFGSEAKALFASGEVRAAADLAGLDQVFTLWAPQAPRTAFAGVRQLEPGRGARLGAGRDRRAAALVAARPRSARPRRRGSRGHCCATASDCGCGPTFRSAPTSPAGSTRA